MLAPVIVYPTASDLQSDDPLLSPETPDAGTRFERGEPVRFRYTADRPETECAFCADGRCEQRVESSPGWRREVVVHDRPRRMH